MTYKENLKAKIKIDRLLSKLVSTIVEATGRRRLDKALARELLELTDFERREVRDLHLYVRPLEGEIMEVLVLDNELPIYHSTVEDVAMRKTPYWQEMISIRNIKKILNDKDVVASKGTESLKRIHANALARLDLTFTADDLASLLEDAHRGLERKSIAQIQESFDLFFELLDFQTVSFEDLASDLQIFAGSGPTGGTSRSYEHLIFFDENNLSLSLKKGPFSLQSELDVDWIRQYSRGEQQADVQGIGVFEFLSELALENTQD